VFGECHRVLKDGGYVNIIVSDFRDNSHYVPYHADLARYLTTPEINQEYYGGDGFEFILKGIKILVQNNKKLFPYGYPYAYVPNIHHQYILILQKGG
jgi:hypothetical protein